MRRFPIVLALALAVGGSAWAGNEKRRKPAEFQDVTEEDRTAARERARNRMTTWREVEPIEESHFPWLQVGFIGLTFLIVTPFAWSFYNRSSKELRDADAFANGQPKKRTKPAAAAASDEPAE
jgi:hypothetical protein